jgi:hypothetical protein
MVRRLFLLVFAALLVTLVTSSRAQSWGCYHVGYTHWGPYTGLRHYGYTGVGAGYGGLDRYGGYYGGYHYGGYGYGGYRYGYYRRW